MAQSAGPAVRLVTIWTDLPPGGTGFDEFVDSARSEVEKAPRSAGDLAIVGYPSGTAGLPKGAMISRRARNDQLRAELARGALDGTGAPG